MSIKISSEKQEGWKEIHRAKINDKNKSNGDGEGE